MEIRRDRYLRQLTAKMWNGRIKVITGIRRCGKSYLLNKMFVTHLLNNGVSADDMIILALDQMANALYRNPIELDRFLRSKTSDPSRKYYVMLDEIQKVESISNPYLPKDSNEKIGFIDVLLGFVDTPNIDVYVTGSNSRMLSKDVITEFRDRGDEIHVSPLTFSEFLTACQGDTQLAWRDFCFYGGMPYIMQLTTHEEKSKYLHNLLQLTYIRDVTERNSIKADSAILDTLLDITASAVGSLTNPSRLAATFESTQHISVKSETIARYLDHFTDAFLLRQAQRYDVKGKAYISTPLKYYYSDVGLRNAKLNFRQQDEGHIMENILYNELIARGFTVDVGVVSYSMRAKDGKQKVSHLEVDFVVNKGYHRYYIQSALNIDTEEKRLQETNSLNRIDDSFTKIVVLKDNILPWCDERGILYIGIREFLTDYIDRRM